VNAFEKPRCGDECVCRDEQGEVCETDWTGVLLGDEMQVKDGWEGLWGDDADGSVSRSSTDPLCWMRFV